MLSIAVDHDLLRVGDRFAVAFQRTLRIPDDGRAYPLPPGLGRLPLHRVRDYRDRVPAAWRDHDALFLPMYQREALWLAFEAAPWKPNAVKVGIGGVNAVSGGAWDSALHADPQDYLVCPPQLWLDGINAGEHFIRQFVATPLGQGYTVEAQLTGTESVGGIQLLVYEPVPGRFPDEPPPRAESPAGMPLLAAAVPAPMGIGAGGKMTQKIYPDPYGIDTWDAAHSAAVSVYIVNSEQYRHITGRAPPPTPISAQAYAQWKLPWFALYDEELGDVPAPARLARVRSVQEQEVEGGVRAEGNDPVDVPPERVRTLRHSKGGPPVD